MKTTYKSKKTKTIEDIPCFLRDGSKREDPTRIRRSDGLCVTKSCNASSILNPETGECISKNSSKGRKLNNINNINDLFSDDSLRKIQDNRFKQSRSTAKRVSRKKRTIKRTSSTTSSRTSSKKSTTSSRTPSPPVISFFPSPSPSSVDPSPSPSSVDPSPPPSSVDPPIVNPVDPQPVNQVPRVPHIIRKFGDVNIYNNNGLNDNNNKKLFSLHSGGSSVLEIYDIPDIIRGIQFSS